MISTEIYIENYRLDLVEDILTEFTYTIDDIQDFGQKNTSYSKTINLTGTANNNQIFGFIFNLNSNNLTDDSQPNVLANFNAAKAAQCRIFIDKIQIFKGVLRLMEIVQNGDDIQYQCSVYGDLGGFMSALGNKRLSGNDNLSDDLDFSAYNQIWNYTNIQNSWNTIAGSGVYFPLIDYGQVSTAKVNFKYPAFRPALYVREYLEKILTGSGYTWNFPMLTSSALMQRLVIPNNQLELSTTSTSLCSTSVSNATYSYSLSKVPLNAISLGSFTISGGNQLNYGGSSSVISNIRWSLSGKINACSSTPSVQRFNLYINGTVISYYDLYISAIPSYFSLSILVNNITINPSDIIYISTPSAVTNITLFSGGITINSNTPVKVKLNYGDTLTINDLIPQGIFQRDFFLSICKMFNLYVYDDPVDSKKLIIKPYIDFYSGQQVDWTNKIDRSKPMSIKPMSELNARYYQFKFKQDNDYYAENYRKKFNEGYGDRLYDTEFDFVKDTVTTEVIFAPSILYQAASTDKRYPAIYKKSNNTTTEDKMDSVIRILQAQKITGVASWTIQDDAGTTLSTQTSYGYAGHLFFVSGTPTEDINFGVPKELQITVTTYPTTNLFNAYYSDYMSEITDKDSRLLVCNALLNTVDILNLDFSKIVWIDGVAFRLNKVDAFNPMEYTTTKIELLKAINTTF
jgi:hypothetical protein